MQLGANVPLIFLPPSRFMWRCLVLTVVLCVEFLGASTAIADIRETPHNLIRARDKTVNERAVCVFCHTPAIEIGEMPEGEKTTRHPLWQQSLAADHVFAIYDDIGRLGLGKPSVGSQSIACLSCHDANQAFELGRTSADHPFGVPYRGAIKHTGRATQAFRGSSAQPFRVAQHLTALEDFRDASQGMVEGRSVWWVSKDGITARRTRADLPLYGRREGTGSGEDEMGVGTSMVPYIECSSCHDPHSQARTFLRVANEGSKLCLTCHDK